MAEVSRCRSCGAPIRWARTAANGALIPLDAEPNPAGNVELVDGRAVVHGQPPLLTPPELWMPHHATCPNWGDR